MESSLDYLDDSGRASLIKQIQAASNLAEVQVAQSALRQWRRQYPHDLGIWDAGEELSLMEEALLEDDSPPGQSLSWTQWQRLEYQVIGARTLPEITAARHALQQWVGNHPEHAKAEYMETLFLLLEVVEEQQTKAPLGDGAVHFLPMREPAGRAG